MVDSEARRSWCKVDRLPLSLKDTVEQMLLARAPYREIVKFLASNGEQVSASAICTFAKKFDATVKMMNVAQSNFSVLMEEMQKYPDLDTSEALIRLSSHHVINALTSLEDSALKEVPVDKLIRETNSLIRAAAYKKRIEVQNQESFESGLDAIKAIVFEAMAKEKPELYKQVNEFLIEKKNSGEM